MKVKSTKRQQGRDTLACLMQVGLVTVASILATWMAANQADVKAVDGNEPQNAPTFRSHLAQAKAICGGPVVKTGPEKRASHVVVVRLNGQMTLMDVGEAIDRFESKTEADNVWAVAICRKHLER